MLWRTLMKSLIVPAQLTVDEHVGCKLTQFRTAKDIGSPLVAEAIGVSPAQLVLVEEGGLRLSAPQLFVLSKLLNVPVASFFDLREGKA